MVQHLIGARYAVKIRHVLRFKKVPEFRVHKAVFRHDHGRAPQEVGVEDGKAVGVLQGQRGDCPARRVDLEISGNRLGVEAEIIPALAHKLCRARGAGRGNQQPKRRMHGEILPVIRLQQDVIPDPADFPHGGILTAKLSREKEVSRPVGIHQFLPHLRRKLRGEGKHGIAPVDERGIAGKRPQRIPADKHDERSGLGRRAADCGFDIVGKCRQIAVGERHAGVADQRRRIGKAFKIPEFPHIRAPHFPPLASFSFFRTSSRPAR